MATALYVCSAGQSFATGVYPECRGYRGVCKNNYDYLSCISTYETSRGTGNNNLKGWQCQWDPVDRYTPPCWSSRLEHNKVFRCHSND